jgi:serine/threonine-protein kinase HipA
MVSVERRDLALEVGRFGRAASLYNILSRCEVFGLSKHEAQALIDGMLAVVRGWREFFIARGVERRSIDMLEQAMLSPSFFRDTPPDAV